LGRPRQLHPGVSSNEARSPIAGWPTADEETLQIDAWEHWWGRITCNNGRIRHPDPSGSRGSSASGQRDTRAENVGGIHGQGGYRSAQHPGKNTQDEFFQPLGTSGQRFFRPVRAGHNHLVTRRQLIFRLPPRLLFIYQISSNRARRRREYYFAIGTRKQRYSPQRTKRTPAQNQGVNITPSENFRITKTEVIQKNKFQIEPT